MPGAAAGSALPTLAVLAAAYVLSQFFRTTLAAAVAPEIAADLGLDPARLGSCPRLGSGRSPLPSSRSAWRSTAGGRAAR